VATGGSDHVMLPVLLLVPRIGGPPGGYAMLGYGDVVLPGLLLVRGPDKPALTLACTARCLCRGERTHAVNTPCLGECTGSGHSCGTRLCWVAVAQSWMQLRMGPVQGRVGRLSAGESPLASKRGRRRRLSKSACHAIAGIPAHL